MSRDSQLKLVMQPQEYFYELLCEAWSQRAYKPQPETEVYLVNLLNRFMTTDALYPRDTEGHHREEPLALMVKEALETSGHENQGLLFRQVGDVSLYTAGFFQDSLNRKLVDVDYYVNMGGVAYSQAARRVDEAALRAIFEELASSFGTFVDVLAGVSDRTMIKSEKSLLETYDLWTRTKSERAQRTLEAAGILPDPKRKKSVQ